MNSGLMLLAMAGIMGGVMWVMKEHGEDDAPKRAEPLPTPPTPGLPPPVINVPPVEIGGFAMSLPPSPVPIPGGSYIEGIGWCPPGMAYNLATKMCEPQFQTTTQGCDRCEHE